jgi:hypothetical protein
MTTFETMTKSQKRLTGDVESWKGWKISVSRDFRGYFKAYATNGSGALLSTPSFSGKGSRQSAIAAIRKAINAAEVIAV